MPEVRSEADSHIGRIILSAKHPGNALSAEIARDICSALTSLEEDDDIKVVVLSAQGDDLTVGRDPSEIETILRSAPGGHNHKVPSQRARLVAAHDLWWGPAGLFSRLLHCRKITITAAKGRCFDAGLYFCLCSDLVVAADTARFASPRWRHVGVDGDIAMLISAVGLKRAKEMIYAGACWSASQASGFGLVDEVTSIDEHGKAVEALARSCALIMRDGISAEKHVVQAGLAKMRFDLGFAAATIAASWGSNIHFREGEFNFLREARSVGINDAIRMANAYFEGHCHSN
jgi:2-(1,2-epoxy-1,2-dihydrophenyl)acetyl-CoA isomerase